MDYNWSREEIALTRRAWIMRDMDEELRKHEMYHNIFTSVCCVVGATTIVALLVWVLI